jgi:hypothetical protein
MNLHSPLFTITINSKTDSQELGTTHCKFMLWLEVIGSEGKTLNKQMAFIGLAL